METEEDEESMEAAVATATPPSPSSLTPPQSPHTLQLPERAGEMPESNHTSLPLYRSPHQQQVSMTEYHSQADDCTREAVRLLKASPEYKAHTQRCLSCGSVWYEGGVGEGCVECSGHAMTRPCPVCGGQCGAVWTRSVSLSRSFHEAHWNGECKLSEEQRTAKMLQTLVQPDHNELTDAMQDLGR